MPSTATVPRHAGRVTVGRFASVAAVVLAVIMAFGTEFNAAAGPTPSPTPIPVPTADQGWQRDGSLDLSPATVTLQPEIKFTLVSQGEVETLTATAKGVFVFVEMIGVPIDQPVLWIRGLQKLTAADGSEYRVTDDADNILGPAEYTLPAGKHMGLRMAFDVPLGTVPASLELHSAPDTPGVVIPLGA